MLFGKRKVKEGNRLVINYGCKRYDIKVGNQFICKRNEQVAFKVVKIGKNGRLKLNKMILMKDAITKKAVWVDVGCFGKYTLSQLKNYGWIY